MKKLHTFEVEYNIAGEKKVRNVILAKPSPRQLEEGEMEYAATIANFVRKGIMTRAMLFKKYEDQGGGPLPESAEKELIDLRNEYVKASLEFTRLEAKKDSELKAEDRLEKTKLTSKLTELQRKLVDLEAYKDSVWSQNSAEKLTMDKMIYWWLFELIHVQDEHDENSAKLFKFKSFEENKDAYYQLEEDEDPFWMAAKNKIFGMIWFLYYNQKAVAEDFVKYEEEFYPILKDSLENSDQITEVVNNDENNEKSEPVRNKRPRKPRGE